MCKWLLGFSLIVRLEALLLSLFFPPTLWFQHQLAFFNLTFICVFGTFLGLGYLECLEVPLVHQEVFLPIFRGGIGFIFVKIITLVAYLVNWGLIVPIITFIFL
jgi:hypothetical protein